MGDTDGNSHQPSYEYVAWVPQPTTKASTTYPAGNACVLYGCHWRHPI